MPYKKPGAPLSKSSNAYNKAPFESGTQTPVHGGVNGLSKTLSRTQLEEANFKGGGNKMLQHQKTPSRSDTMDSAKSGLSGHNRNASSVSIVNGSGSEEHGGTASPATKEKHFTPRPGYRQWVAQSGTLVADLLTCAGADHVITMDLHDPQYQGFFDIPVDNLHSRLKLKDYIQKDIPNYQQAVVVSPDAGGAKRATAIADSLGMPFALIHRVNHSSRTKDDAHTRLQEQRPTKISDRQNATMLLVGNVANRVVILIDDLADTSNTITRAAKLLKKEGAVKVYALITHGVLSGEALDKLNASALDKLIVTNSVPQEEHVKKCPKLEVLDVAPVFAEVCQLFVCMSRLTISGDTTCSLWREHQCSIQERLRQVHYISSRFLTRWR